MTDDSFWQESPNINPQKTRQTWGLTYFPTKENSIITQSDLRDLSENVKNLYMTKSGTRRVDKFVLQLEVCPTTNKYHVHMFIKFDSSKIRPIPQFKANFPDCFIIEPNNIEEWTKYCCKKETRAPQTEPIFFNIDSKIKDTWKRYKNDSSSEDEDEEEIIREKCRKKLLKQRIMEEEKLKMKMEERSKNQNVKGKSKIVIIDDDDEDYEELERSHINNLVRKMHVIEYPLKPYEENIKDGEKILTQQEIFEAAGGNHSVGRILAIKMHQKYVYKVATSQT